MNKFLNNLERKIGKWAIPNLTMLMIGCYVIGYILQMISPQVFSYMTLEPAYILRGQLWRIVTWILIPPYQMGGDFLGGKDGERQTRGFRNKRIGRKYYSD